MSTVHPSTIAFVRVVLARPGMFLFDHDLGELETMLFGFDAGLCACAALEPHVGFNDVFAEILRRDGASTSTGWAAALQDRHGFGETSFEAFRALFEQHFPSSIFAAEDPQYFEFLKTVLRPAGGR